MKKRSIVLIVIGASLVVVVGFAGMLILIAFSGDFEPSFTGFGPRIAVVEVHGEIIDSRDFVRQMKKWTDNSSVKAIVIDINSPGGGVAASQEMYEQILKTRAADKLVIASMGAVAASGGYYIACAADKIVANPGTLTGSIGVIISFPTAKKLFEKIGIKWETIKSGELKAVGSLDRPMSQEEERMLKSVIMDTYEQFVEAVANGRDRPKEEIYPLADGSIFTGRQAYNFGLVDTLGTFEDAISLAGELSDLGPDPNVVKEVKRKPGFWDILGATTNVIDRLSRIDISQPTLKYLYQ